MNRHKQARATILREAGRIPQGKKVGGRRSSIRTADYCTAAVPANLPAQPVGDCLIWTGPLNSGGYGTGDFPASIHLAHVQAYTQSRGRKPVQGKSVCHLCHRPFCVQPSHLYEGDAQTNADDRRLRRGGGTLPLVFERYEDIQAAARYRWDGEPRDQDTLIAPSEVEVEHECQYIVPAGDVHICAVCENPEDPTLRWKPEAMRLQPKGASRTSHTVVKTGKTITYMGNGITVQSRVEMEINIPGNRAERRRRKRENDKQAPRDKPVLLGQASGVFKVNSEEPLRITMDTPFITPGPGIIALVGRVVPMGPISEAPYSDQE